MLVDYYFKLLSYCQDKEKFNQTTFQGMHDFYTSYYKKMTNEMQGELTEGINKKWETLK